MIETRRKEQVTKSFGAVSRAVKGEFLQNGTERMGVSDVAMNVVCDLVLFSL